MSSMLAVVPLADSQAVAKAETTYTGSCKFRRCVGDAAVWVASTAGQVAISQQCSMDDVTWYDPVNASAAALGSVVAAQTVTTGVYISYTPVIADYIRYKIIEADVAATAVSLKLVFREEV